jgi:serine/threonine protein kinase
MMGVGERSNQAYIINFGLAKQYRDAQTHHHIPYGEHYSLVGTVAFASINNHIGLAPSRRDDLESLAYVLLYFLRGSLPWYGDPSKKNLKQSSAILRKKLGTLADHTFDSLPSEFTTFLSYTRALGFDEEPDYVYIRTLFRDLLIREGHSNDYVFDWCVEATDQKDIATATTTGRRARKENNRLLTSDRVYVPSLSIQSF